MPRHHDITRQIGIDAGHRVTDHGSKCRNLHGHRYTIEATCRGPLYEAGEQAGMVLDFGFLKEEMMSTIDGPCDHGMMLWAADPLLALFLPDQDELGAILYTLNTNGSDRILVDSVVGKLCVLPFVPTAENLARHWYELLSQRVLTRTKDQAKLIRLRVYETPNCWADYGPENEENE